MHQFAVLATTSSVCSQVFLGDHPLACFGQEPSPGASQWDLAAFADTESLIHAAIAAGDMPGCVVCFGSHDQIAWLKAYGDRQIEPTQEAMTVDTIFDLASLTKPLVTATCIMALVDEGS